MKHMLCAVLTSAALVSCGGSDRGPAALADNVGPPSANPEVTVDDSFFAPAELVIPAGTTVNWSWQGRAVHDVAGPGFSSAVQASGAFEYTFEEIGTYTYRCTLHPGMDGLVHVIPAS